MNKQEYFDNGKTRVCGNCGEDSGVHPMRVEVLVGDRGTIVDENGTWIKLIFDSDHGVTARKPA